MPLRKCRCSLPSQQKSCSPRSRASIEYRNSHKKPALLKVEGSVYRGKTCRITLATPRVPEVLEALKDREQLLLRVDPHTCYHLVIAPSDPQNSLPVAVRYVLGAL